MVTAHFKQTYPAGVVVHGRGEAVLVFALDDEPELRLVLHRSNLPNWLDRPRRNIVAITLGKSAHLSPELGRWDVSRLASLLAHEWRHRWQRERYGIWYAPMAIWRVLTDGYHNSDMERDADWFEGRYQPWFIVAASKLLASDFFRD